MRIIRGFGQLRPFNEGCVATIGNFDGIHLGHRAVIESLAARARTLGLPVAVMLFEPQPLELFKPTEAPSRLTRLREKILHLAELPVDAVVVLRFNLEFADISAGRFIRNVLVERFHIRHLVVGDDFRFGRGRAGNYLKLNEAGVKFGFTVEDTPSFEIDRIRVSSTGIRQALEQGDLDTAQRLLGRPYSICGRIVQGRKKGRSIDFPTANIRLHRTKPPVQGVFAVTVSGIENGVIPGVANVGVRPTLGGSDAVLLEVHLFNFNKEIYGLSVEVNFHRKIRNEMKFDSFDALKAQIERDAVIARKILQPTENALV